MTQLVWFRTDLRVRDNPALTAACDSGESVLAVYCLTPVQWAKHGLGERRIRLMKNAVAHLRDNLAELNVPLLVLRAGDFEQSQTLLQHVMQQIDVSHLHYNLEYEVNERRRDQAIKAWCETHDIDVRAYHDQCIVPPKRVLTQSGSMFKVFTPFKRAWVMAFEQYAHAPYGLPKRVDNDAFDINELIDSLHRLYPSQDVIEQSLTVSADALWTMTEQAAHEQLERFVHERVHHYQRDRDYPAKQGVSRLSAWLAVGVLSPRQCFYPAWQANGGLVMGGEAGIDCWLSELVWREFYRHLVIAYPELCKHRAFKPETENVQWRNDDDVFTAWCEGRTGVPIVDAAMRQLQDQGWMHNRLRMITAMYLTKQLLTDWRKGEAWFNQWLVDADLASNNGGWQWSASTGADGAPYFRIFNPTSQSEKFDAQGDFIRHYVPELNQLNYKYIHSPTSEQRKIAGYPEPIVDHKWARQAALDAFKQVNAMGKTQ